MDGLFQYMSQYDKNYKVREAVINNKLLHLNTQFDLLMMEHEEYIGLINTKVLMENGTENDLTCLLISEAEEIQKKGKGILGSIISAVKALFRNIKTFLFGKKVNTDKLPPKIELPDKPDTVQSECNSLINNIQSFLSGNKKALTGLTAVAATAGAVLIGKNAVAPTIKNLEELANQTEKICGESESHLDELNPEEQNILRKAITSLKNYGNRALKIVKAIPQMNSQDYKDIRDKNKEAAKEEKEKAAEQKKADADNAANERDTNTIETSQRKQEDQEKKMEELRSQISKYKEYIKKLESKIPALEKELGIDNPNLWKHIASSIGERKARKEQAELETLSRIKPRKRNAKQAARYRDLLAKYGTSNATARRKLQNIQDLIFELQTRINAAKEALAKRNDEKNNERDKELDAAIRRAERGGNSTRSIENRVNALLNESVDDSISWMNELLGI